MTKIKMCGFTGLDSAVFAAGAGADFIGLIFAPSKRRVSLETARAISRAIHILEEAPKVVGVFVNEEVTRVNNIAEYCDLDFIQLSGDENMDYARQIKRPVIKVVHVTAKKNAGITINEIEQIMMDAFGKELILLLDTKLADAYGGTGQSFDWGVAKEAASRYPVIVAGGLTPENVGELVRDVKPWGVDISSGIEVGGSKSESKILEFINAVRAAEPSQ